MTRRIRLRNGKEVSIYYRDGVEQSRDSVWNSKRTVENIPFSSIKNWDITKEEARKKDDNYEPRPHLYHGNKKIIVQNNWGVPEDMWNVEMYNYESECMERKWVDG